MSQAVGIDLSTFALDIVRLEEETNDAVCERVLLAEAPPKAPDAAWQRLLSIRSRMPPPEWWEDVYVVAIEAPYGSNQGGSQAKLNRVAGAIASALPAALRHPDRCWIVRPDEWKRELGLKRKPTTDDVDRLLPGLSLDYAQASLWLAGSQDQWDALCLALYARRMIAQACAPGEGATPSAMLAELPGPQ